MLRAEFKRWLDRYMILFPESADWIDRIPADRRGPMLSAWAKELESVEYRDVLAATELMFGGDDPEFPPLGVMFGDRERTPAHVKRLACKVRHRRMQAEAKRRDDEQRREARLHGGRTRYKYSMGELFRFLMDRKAAGDPEAVAKMRAMADELPGPDERGYEPSEGYGELFQ